MRHFAIAYGAAAYLIFFAVFLYMFFFLAGLPVPKTIDSGVIAPFGTAVAINLALLILFGLQHSVMARPTFKALWTRIVPEPIERSTYVLVSSLVLAFIMWQWQPMPGTVWQVTNGVAAGIVWTVYVLGWLLVLVSTFAIDHFDLFGLRQVFNFFHRQPPASPEFKEGWLYRLVRHPLMLGFVIVFWAAPVMSEGRLLFAAGMTLYILIALNFEERDLAVTLGNQYREYQTRVPMLVPFARRPSESKASSERPGKESGAP